MNRRKTAFVAVGVVGAIALAAGVVVVVVGHAHPPDPAGPAGVPAVQTVAVVRSDLATTLSNDGTLGYGSERPVKGGAGTVTWLPAIGATVARGAPLLRVDDRPVALFYGDTPLFRPLEAAGTTGRDVRVVADNLAALGYAIGPQPPVGTKIGPAAAAAVPADPVLAPDADAVKSGGPAPVTAAPAGSEHLKSGDEVTSASPAVAPEHLKSGDEVTSASPAARPDAAGGAAAPTPTPGPASGSPADVPVTVRPGDAVFTPSLKEAVRRWQRKVGIPATGSLAVGDVVVQPQQVRVASTTAHLGDPADSSVLSVTDTTKVVSIQVSLGDADAVRQSRTVDITLPDGTTTPGQVSSVSRVVAAPDDGAAGPPAGVTVTVRPVDPDALSQFDSSPVRVEFTASARQGVLAVPVAALLALREGGYAVQLGDGRLVRVTTGLFAKGMVEISGAGIAEGTKVVTAS